MTLSDGDMVHMTTMFFIALGGIPDVMLEAVAEGDEEALEIVKTSTSMILRERRKAESAPLN